MPEAPNPHSGFGIASFIIALISLISGIILVVGTIIVSAGLVKSTGTIDPQIVQHNPAFILIGLGFFGAILLDLIGGILGIVGLFQKNRKKVFSILGVIISFLPMVGFGLLAVIALIARSQM
ncbi:MAG: hypothetical protein A2189_00570 [Paenibacillus sp. RIFOXYA1_FULL_44_5]|nr:MAG: hypothetical protein A2189_00570 [Paenibacillus sp. RIFOXYA1_FULL_44_5]